MSISDKVAVVCGSTSGIGKATAILLAQRGCKLILLSRNEDLKSQSNIQPQARPLGGT